MLPQLCGSAVIKVQPCGRQQTNIKVIVNVPALVTADVASVDPPIKGGFGDFNWHPDATLKAGLNRLTGGICAVNHGGFGLCHGYPVELFHKIKLAQGERKIKPGEIFLGVGLSQGDRLDRLEKRARDSEMPRPSQFGQKKEPWQAWLTPTAMKGLDKLAERYGYEHKGLLLEAIGRGELSIREIEPGDLSKALAAAEGVEGADLIRLLGAIADKAELELIDLLESEL